MPSSDELQQIAETLRSGGDPGTVSVREFLGWFGAQRRGSWIVWHIRSLLRMKNLITVPDFESAYIDSPISFALEDSTGTDDAENASPIDDESASHSIYADPTYRISKLEAANRPPITIAPDASLEHATTLMLSNDYSQLPVTVSDRHVKGVISWTSVGIRSALKKTGDFVRDFMDPHQEIRADSSLFQAIPIIEQFGYVLIRSSEGSIQGIVTSSDLSSQFRQLAEPFLLLGEIENHIRHIISRRFECETLSEFSDPKDGGRTIESVADLTFGEYVRLLENPKCWDKLALAMDRVEFCKELDRVRRIRNDVMHFDPDGIPPADLKKLRDFGSLLQKLHDLGLPGASAR